MMTSSNRIRVFAGLTAIAAIAACQVSTAAPITWNGLGADQNWSTPGNWDGSVPPGATDDVKFSDFGGGGSAGVVDNIVDTSRTVLSLQFAQTNSTTFHTTLLNPGVTLTLAGSLINGNEGQNDTRVTDTITGTGGTLIVSAPTAVINVRQPASVSAANRTTLDLSSLDTLNATVARVMVGVATNNSTVNRATGRLLLARTNVITTSGAAPQVDVADSVGSSNNGNGSTLSLGQTNAIFTDSITVGRGRESAATFNFNSAFTSPSVFIRGTNGLSSRVSLWTVGDAATQTGTITCRGTVNLFAGTIDAMVDQLILGRPSLGTADASQSQGTLIVGAGNLDVNTFIIGNQRTNNGASAGSSASFTGTTITVHSNLFLTLTTGGAGATTTTGTLNLTNSTLVTPGITNGGGGTTTINLDTATLVVSNQVGSITSPIGTLSTANSTFDLAADASIPAIIVNTLTVNGASDVINISSAPAGTGQFPLITFSSLNSQLPDFTIGTLPTGIQGYISNNTSSVDLVITNSIFHIDTWRGNVNGDWDTATLNWFSGHAVAYSQNDPVVLDDTATGTRNVNLTTVLTPDSIAVNNSGGDYTFSGSGKLSGTTGLTKAGTGMLTLNATGGDDFSGGISVNQGTLVLDNANSIISGGLTIASGATVQVGSNDVNGNVVSPVVNNGNLVVDRSDNLLVSTGISGAGALVKLGNGTLTLSNAMSYSGDTAVFKGTLALAGSTSLSNSANVVISNATFDVTGVASGVSTLNTLSLNDSTLNVGTTNSKTPISVTFVTLGGSANVVNISALPPIASYPANITLVQTLNGVSGTAVSLGTLPAATPAYSGTVHISQDGLSIQLTLNGGPVGQRSSEFWTGADVLTGVANTNWSDAQNWQLPGAPGVGDNVIFNNTGAQFSSALNAPGAGFAGLNPFVINNIVDDNFTLSSLVFTNFGNTYHNTFINSGKVLSVTNNVLTVGALDTGASTQQGFVNVIGTNATLSVNNTNANIQIWLGNASSGGSQATLDLSALDSFSTTNSRLAIGASINNTVNRVSGILYLAKTNNINATFQTTTSDTGTTTANGAIVVGDANSNAGSASSLYLGLVNTISADTIGIGRQKAPAHFLFNPIYANIAPYPTVTLQGYSGSRVSFFEVGNGAGNSGTTTFTADANLGGGFVNAMVDTLNVSRSPSGGTAGTITGTLNFDAGTINANTLNIGLQPINGTKNAIGSVGVSSNTIMGAAASLTVNGNLTLALAGDGTAASTSSGTLNITNGTVSANAIITGTNTTSTINTIGGRLNVATTIGNASAPLTTLSLTPMNTPDNSNTVLQVSAALNPSVVVNNLNIDGLDATTNIINISSVAPVTVPQELPVIKYAALNMISGGTFNIGLGTLPTGYTGYLTNDTTLGAIAVVITTAAPPSVPPTIQKISIVNGNIVISGTNNAGTGGTYHLLTSTNVALPLAQWTVLTSGSFNSDGSLNSTNAVDSTKPNNFYILQVP